MGQRSGWWNLCPGTAASREPAFFWQQKKARKENCRCFDAADPRPRGCTPLGFPKRRSQRARAKRKQYYFSFLTPAPSAPFVNSGVPPNPRRGERKAPLSKGDSPLRGEMSRSDRGARARRAGRASGLGDSDGPCATTRSRSITRQLEGAGCRPPLPLSCTTHLWQSVGAGHARPAALPLPPVYLLPRREGS